MAQFLIVFHNLKNYDANLMQGIRKFYFYLNAIPNGLEKYLSFKIKNKLFFIDSFQHLGS